MEPYRHRVQVYYEDTDFSGVVYHANYLKFFERAREHILGVGPLVSLYEDEGIGFVVYKAELNFRRGARFGDTLEIRTRVEKASGVRLLFHQDAYRVEPGPDELLVKGEVQLACVDRNQNLVAVPKHIVDRL